MKTIIVIILLSCSVAHAQSSGVSDFIEEIGAMHKAKIWGKINNDIARDAPPIKYQIENTYKVEAPAYPAPSNYAPVPSGSIYYNGGYDLQALAKALAAKPEKHANSPFNDSYMPGVK